MKWRIVLVPFAFLVVFVSRLLKPFILIRFGEIWSSRLGHLIGNTECYLCEKPEGVYDIFFYQPIVANKVIGDKYRKILHVWPYQFAQLVSVVNRFFNGWEQHVAQSDQIDRDIHNLWRKPHLTFTKEENKRGQQLLRDLGIPAGAKWVCLIVRDSAYLKDKGDFAYHNYRDADIDNYKKAAILLAGRGYYVIRMGSVVEKPFDTGLKFKVIDYATSGKRTEFGDLYLGAKCAFCVGTSTGFMAIPQVFKRPCAVTDFVPVEYISTFFDDLVIWKHHMKDKKRMSFEDILKSGAGQFMQAEDFENAGIKLVNNTPKEIADLAIEMDERLAGKKQDDQKEFWDIFPRSTSPYNMKPLHGKMKARIGREFLKGYQ